MFSLDPRMDKFKSLFWLLKLRFQLACFGWIFSSTYLPDFEHSKNFVCRPIWRIMVPSQMCKIARKHQCTELKSVWHIRASFLFRPVVSSSFQIAPILLLLQWIRMPFIIISFYFVALLKLQDNDGFSFLFDESLFPKSAAILLPLSGWHLHM